MTPEEIEQIVVDISMSINSAAITLSQDEQRWVKMAIKKEAQSIELRKAIIEKTLSGLVWSAIVGFGYIFLNWATTHGYRP